MAASAAAPLKIAHASVQQYEDGPPVYRPDSFAAGEAVHFSFQIEGFTRKEDKVSVSFEAQPLDPSGVPLTPVIKGEEQTTLSPEDKDWAPKLRGSFELPATLLPGTYRISVQVRDELAAAPASAEIPFLVAGAKVEKGDTLAIRNLNFYLNDGETRPLEKAAFRIGEQIHARFQIVGFRHDEKGAMDVTYGIAVADVSGHVVFQEPAAARDANADFYPKPFVPGILEFSLTSGTPPGVYVLTVTAHDAAGDQRTEEHRAFRIE